MTDKQIQQLKEAGYEGGFDTLSLIKSCTDHFGINKHEDGMAVSLTLNKEVRTFTGADLDGALINAWIGKFVK